MKTKYLWLTALAMLLVLAVMYGQQSFKLETSLIGVNQNAVLFATPQSPIMQWGKANSFRDGGLKLSSKALNAAVDVTNFLAGERQTWPDLTAQMVQPGAWLLELQNQRVWLLADPFLAEDLNPSLPVDYRSDWTILQRSSLLPAQWPEPRHGWVVLNSGTMSQRLKAFSLESRKPVVRPVSGGTVWLEYLAEGWQVQVPTE